MTRSNFFYIILGIHVLCGILGLIILSFIDVYDRIRWSIGDMLRLLFFLTPFVLIFCVPKKMPTWSKVCMRIYCVVYITIRYISSIMVDDVQFRLCYC